METLPELFRLTLPAWEIIMRGTVVYLSLVLLFRFVVRREVGAVGLADLLILVLIADASQNAMAGESKTIADGLVLICTLLGWSLILDRAAFHFPKFRKIIEADKLLLIDRGKILRRNLRKEFITEEELLAKLRSNGLEEAAEVKQAYLESDGEITVIPKNALASPVPSASIREKI